MTRVLLFSLFYTTFLTGCLQMPSRYNTPSLDECNFSVSPFGIGHRWKKLPVELTFHSESFHQDAQRITMKVIDEWNHIWRNEGQNTDLFQVIGGIRSDIQSIENDRLNSITLVDSRSNRSCDNTRAERCFLQRTQQGVTSLRGVGFSSVAEADIFVNVDDYEFHYGSSNRSYTALSSRSDRGLASYSESPLTIFWARIVGFFARFLGKDRGLASDSPSIPRHMVDFESLIAHELGHVLALGHNQTVGSIMNTHLRLGVTRRGLRSIELNSLLCGYGK